MHTYSLLIVSYLLKLCFQYQNIVVFYILFLFCIVFRLLLQPRVDAGPAHCVQRDWNLTEWIQSRRQTAAYTSPCESEELYLTSCGTLDLGIVPISLSLNGTERFPHSASASISSISCICCTVCGSRCVSVVEGGTQTQPKPQQQQAERLRIDPRAVFSSSRQDETDSGDIRHSLSLFLCCGWWVSTCSTQVLKAAPTPNWQD